MRSSRGRRSNAEAASIRRSPSAEDLKNRLRRITSWMLLLIPRLSEGWRESCQPSERRGLIKSKTAPKVAQAGCSDGPLLSDGPQAVDDAHARRAYRGRDGGDYRHR